jgi:hypothetical protein
MLERRARLKISRRCIIGEILEDGLVVVVHVVFDRYFLGIELQLVHNLLVDFLVFFLLPTRIFNLLNKLSGKAVVALYFWFELNHKAVAYNSLLLERLPCFVQFAYVYFQSQQFDN